MPDPIAAAPEAAAPVVAAPVVEPTYALKSPENSGWDDKRLAAETEFYKGAKVDPAVAQALLNRSASQEAASLAAREARWSQTTKDWRAEIEADPVYGGQKLAESDAGVKSVLSRFAPPEYEAWLRETGSINIPGFHKMLVNVSRAIAEGSVLKPGAAIEPQLSAEEKFYPNNPEMWPAEARARRGIK